MFEGMDFIFNDIPSELYGVKIGFLDSANARTSFSGISRSIEEYRIKRKSKPLFQGVEVSNKIEFDLILFSENEIDTYDRQFIDSWLLQSDYKFFNIVQEDYDGLFFKCIITSGEKIAFGSKPFAKRLHFVCDDAYAYTDIQKYTFYSSTTPSTVRIKNIGNINEYFYVEDMTINVNLNGNVLITNTTDNNRLFSLTGVSTGEIITVDNDRKILSSSVSSDRINVFNKKWFRLLPNFNDITLQGNFTLTINARYKVTV